MSVITTLLSLLGDNNLVSAVIPSMALMLATLVVFDPIFKTSAFLQQQNSADSLIVLGLLIIFPIIILSYTLMALNTYIFKLHEGYVFFHHFPFLRKAHLGKAQALILKREALKKRIAVIERKKFRYGGRLDETLNRLKRRYFSVAAEYDSNYPPSLDDILPTKFGNILRASESYAATHYGLDGVAFWPLLIAVIPPEYQKAIDAARNELAFLVNMSFLAIVFFVFCVMAIPFEYNALPYMLAGLVALCCNAFFNQAATYSVSSFGVMIRSAFDLFRLDLLKQFRLKAPTDSVEEFYIWKNLNEFIVVGEQSLKFVPLVYDVPKNAKDSTVLNDKEQKSSRSSHKLGGFGLKKRRNSRSQQQRKKVTH